MQFFTKIITAIFILYGLTNLHAQENELSEQAQFEALSPAEKEEFYQIIEKSRALIKQKKTFEALDHLAKADAIIPDHTMTLIQRAGVNIAHRNFEPVEELYTSLVEQYPANVDLRYNLAEMYFVQSKWKEASVNLLKLMRMLRTNKNSLFYHLATFKQYICALKLNDTEAIKKGEEAFDFSSDTPAYYFINFVKHKHNGDEDEAQRWLKKARRIYPAQTVQVWSDSARESGYMASIDGGGDRSTSN